MNVLKTLNIAVGIGAAIFFASLAPPAQAMDNDNPWLPTIVQSDGAEPMKISDPAYCSKEITKTCQGLDLLNGYGEGNKLGLPAREGKHHVDPKPTPTCEPKSKV